MFTTFKKPGKGLMRKTPLKPSGFRRAVAKSMEKRVPKAPKLNPSRKRATAEERAYMGMVASHGCAVCEFFFGLPDTPAEVHHLKAGGGSKRASHYDTMPLCPEHHRGDTGIHLLGQERFAARYGITETNLLAWFKRKAGVSDA